MASITLVAACCAVPSGAGAEPSGVVVVARTTPVAVLIWDASATVADLVIARDTGDAGMRRLQIAALDVLAAHAPRLSAKTVEFRVQYAPTGIVGAAYQASTFANAVSLLDMRAQTATVLRRHAEWATDIAAQRATSGLAIEVDAPLPRPH